MRNTDERAAAVRSRSRRLRRRRANLMFAMSLCLAAILLVGFAGGHAVFGPATGPATGASLFGASSLFGPSVGGYVLVALLAAAAAATATLLLTMRRRRADGEGDDPKKNERLHDGDNGEREDSRKGACDG